MRVQETMKKSERFKWIQQEVEKRVRVDIYDSRFVDDYIAAVCPPQIGHQPYGAHRVPMLSRDLAEMFKKKLLKRVAVGIGDGLFYQGFAKWVYSYGLSDE